MKRLDNLITRKLLIFLTGVFLIVGLAGCGDPVAANREIEHQNLMNIAEQHLQQGLCAQPVATDHKTRYQNLMNKAQQPRFDAFDHELNEFRKRRSKFLLYQ